MALELPGSFVTRGPLLSDPKCDIEPWERPFTESLAANILDWYPATIWLRGVELVGPEALPLLRPWRSGELASGLPGP
ncbi:hypothetical protein KBZ18_13995 [Synechococcus sp. Cruz-9H2]|uniref:hypothetical protein n=1 Tax=unclassified Synechococcus TaxID=2626047 RepID=UPI0020CEA5F7|nr:MULTISPECIES: hypothetical protein [unclassified Synechococcus]MCP9820596.1 hypothetical protein [Synechococcus sp. Cruz-9H2]MCP9844767.1 hypothetical protein [Synechococcus sp. Edmonson 11F2]MCP9856952.1 hypothetical protein [Synechococcus sp. Cruz-9C9]MCP9864237.1 hypothetical protein [Synechococcus sp. Cruz-7E5]MCP9871444.1 hypothetical protein [Synechococcus sp. Cruz-7B9]